MTNVLVLAQTGGQVSIQWQAVTLLMVGMGVVFAALVLLMLGMWLIRRFEPRPRSTSPQVTAVQGLEHPIDSVDPQFIAVLAAAATVALGRRVRIQRVRFVGRVDPTWARAGRQELMGSHNPVQRHF